jgi:large subunit ribosomal protein L5
LGSESQNVKSLESSLLELAKITAQCGFVTRSRIAISGFKIREKIPVGLSVTLRSERIYAFLDRLINLALPRVQDFKGVNPQRFDGFGNYNMGLKEQTIFPEIRYEQIDQLRGIGVCIVTTSTNDLEGRSFLKRFGIPFQTFS